MQFGKIHRKMNFFSLSEKYFFITFVLQRNTEFAFLYLNELGVVKHRAFFYGITEIWELRIYGITESRIYGVMDFWNFCLMINETIRQLVVRHPLVVSWTRCLLVCEATSKQVNK